MRNFLLTTILVTMITTGFAQVGIGTNSPNASSILDLTSTNKAFLPPRMTSTQRDAISNPVAGMVIFNTTTTCVEIYRGTGWFNVCTGTTTSPLPPVDGFTSSGQVASTNLIAYWPFDASGAESISGVSALTTGTYAVGSVNYAGAGKIGNCATFTNGALVFPAIHNISIDTAMQSYSISMWVNIPAATGSEGLRSLFQVNANTFPDLFGVVAFELSNNGAKGDTLALQARQIQVDGTGPHNQVSGPINKGYTAGWNFITQTYNGIGNNQTIEMYLNGTRIDSMQFTTVTKPQTFKVVNGGGPAFTGTPANMVTIGTFEFNDFPEFQGGDGYGNFTPTAASRPWAQNGITGSIDDIRVFNKDLTAQQISDLYQLGNQGR